MLVTGNNLNTKSQFYIDIDNNHNTGFKAVWSKSGIEYLVENGSLYKYSGKNTAWKWSYVRDIQIKKTKSMIGVSIPLNKLGINVNSTINIGFMSNDNRNYTLPIKTFPLVKYTLGSGTNNMKF